MSRHNRLPPLLLFARISPRNTVANTRSFLSIHSFVFSNERTNERKFESIFFAQLNLSNRSNNAESIIGAAGGLRGTGACAYHLQRTIRNGRVWRTLPHENRYQRRFVPLSIIRRGVTFVSRGIRALATIRHTIENYSIMRYAALSRCRTRFTRSFLYSTMGARILSLFLSLVHISRLIVADSPR